METQMMVVYAGCAAILGFGMCVVWLMLSEERRRAERWCRERGLMLGVFEYGEGRKDFWYVGIDGEGNRWLMPNRGWESVECVREGKDGGIEFYDPREDVGARFVLTWGIVIGIAKVVLVEVAKRAVVRLAEMLLERLKEEWGVRGVATADRVREMAEEMRALARDSEREGEKDIEKAEKVVEAIVREAREGGIGSVEGMSEDEVYEKFLSSVEGLERKVGEGRAESCEGCESEEGVEEAKVEKVKEASPKGVRKETERVEEEKVEKGKPDKAADFVDGYEERGW